MSGRACGARWIKKGAGVRTDDGLVKTFLGERIHMFRALQTCELKTGPVLKEKSVLQWT